MQVSRINYLCSIYEFGIPETGPPCEISLARQISDPGTRRLFPQKIHINQESGGKYWAKLYWVELELWKIDGF